MTSVAPEAAASNLVFDQLTISSKLGKKEKWNTWRTWGRTCQKTTNMICKQCCPAPPRPLHLNQQPFRAVDSCLYCYKPAENDRLHACVSWRKKKKRPLTSDSISLYMQAHAVKSLLIWIKSIYIRPDFLIILQKQYIKSHLWLMISIHPCLRKWNEKNPNKSLNNPRWK